MQITALVQVINYLKEKAADPSVPEGYRKLSETIKEASKNPSGDNWPLILKDKEQLRNILIESEPADWGFESYGLFEKINSGSLFGRSASEYIDKLISPDNKDYQSIATDLNKKAKLFSKVSENLNKFMQLYEAVIPEEMEHTADNAVRSAIFLYFEGRLSVHNVTDLERYSGLWDGILSVFSILNGEEKPELDINSYHSGKIVLEVTPGDKTMHSVMSGTSGILSLLPVILKIRNIQLELAPLPLSNNVNDLLEQEIQDLINNTSLEKANKLIISHFKGASDPDETAVELARSLKQIFSFIEKGGKIEFKPLVAVQDATRINRELAESYIIARELEQVALKLTRALAKRDEARSEKDN